MGGRTYGSPSSFTPYPSSRCVVLTSTTLFCKRAEQSREELTAACVLSCASGTQACSTTHRANLVHPLCSVQCALCRSAHVCLATATSYTHRCTTFTPITAPATTTTTQVAPDRYKATVHPPRGGDKYGVWATRTTHRPNRLGLSLCELVGVDTAHGGVRLRVAGADLLDGTPVLDIKP
jgi:hypothetical protein